MYEELLYVVSHQLGKRKVGGDEISPGDLIVYGQTVFFICFSIRPVLAVIWTSLDSKGSLCVQLPLK